MSDQEKNVKETIAATERKLEVLREIDLLDAEFRLIKNEYLQRRDELASRLVEKGDGGIDESVAS
tara:strand:+ start:194 stop:388 length:195 start_codon:yes stop_codon:yes gene_type:complete